MKKNILLSIFSCTFILTMNNVNAQCDPAVVAHYNMGDFPFTSTSGITVTMSGTNSGVLGPYTQYGCSPATCDANTVRMDPGDATTFTFSQSVGEITIITGVMNTYENGSITTNGGTPTLSTNCPVDNTLTGNAFEQTGALASPVLTITIPGGATEITVNCFAVTQGTGNGVFTIDFLDCITAACSSTSNSITATSCNSYTSPSGLIWTSSNTYMDTIPNATGCDSILTIDLTINTVDVNTAASGPTIIANNTAGTYQWLDCDNSYTPIAGETNQTFVAPINGNYAVSITENGCVDTSACVSISTIGIKEFEKYNLSLFPNPSKGEFTLNYGDEKPNSISILDLQGKLVAEYNKGSMTNFKINVPKGMYIVKIQFADSEKELKLIID